MAGKRTKKLASKSKRVRAIARERLGSPKPARVVADKPSRSKPKYKKNWQEEVETDASR